MKSHKNISFDYDFDSSLYMLSKDPEAASWKVIVHCKGGEKNFPQIEKFIPYPGCENHEGETAWLVDYFKPEKIEIQKPKLKPVIFRYPEGSRMWPFRGKS